MHINWGLVIVIGIIVLIILGIILFFIIKPYIIRYDTTMLFTGGLGSGKTTESVKRAIVCIRKQRIFKYKWQNFKIAITNLIRKLREKHLIKQFYKNNRTGFIIKDQKKYVKRPLLYSNIPIKFKPHIWSIKSEWSTQLDVEHILLLKEINEYSVVVIDEFPQFISQFDWDIDLVQKNCNEFITYFRHYIGGNLITNAQSEQEIECHFRRKLNIGIWCFNFRAWPFPFLPLFYTVRMCDFMLSDNMTTMSTTYVEENTKLHFGFFPGRTLGIFPGKAFDSRCYKPRYKKVKTKVLETNKWKKLDTTQVLRLRPYISPLDDKTTPQQIAKMENEAQKLQRSDEQ